MAGTWIRPEGVTVVNLAIEAFGQCRHLAAGRRYRRCCVSATGDLKERLVLVELFLERALLALREDRGDRLLPRKRDEQPRSAASSPAASSTTAAPRIIPRRMAGPRTRGQRRPRVVRCAPQSRRECRNRAAEPAGRGLRAAPGGTCSDPSGRVRRWSRLPRSGSSRRPGRPRSACRCRRCPRRACLLRPSPMAARLPRERGATATAGAGAAARATVTRAGGATSSTTGGGVTGRSRRCRRGGRRCGGRRVVYRRGWGDACWASQAVVPADRSGCEQAESERCHGSRDRCGVHG